MKRYVDRGFYDFYPSKTDINVKCPWCGGFGIVRRVEDTYQFNCTCCGKKETKERNLLKYSIKNICKKCGKYYRIEIKDKTKQHFTSLYVNCPYCDTPMSGKLIKTATNFAYEYGEVVDAREPLFGYELWFLTNFKGKKVWALNREHLLYLIDYIGATLREKPIGFQNSKTMESHLPTFMKTAKNRKQIIKVLENMRDEK